MGILELFLIAVGLSMDAFAVAICKGLTMKRATARKSLTVGLYFGFFQAIMPLIGYYIGIQFQAAIEHVDHWLAFFLLSVIGINTIVGAVKDDVDTDCHEDLSPKSMLPLALATSIDALAVGVTLAFLSTDILPAVSFIGLITFSLSICGVKIGNLFGRRFKTKAEIFGGIVLLLIGAKVLLEHLGVLHF